MPIISEPQDYNEEDLYIDLRRTIGTPLLLKCEGFNFAGSIKLKAAVSMIEHAERGGRIDADSVLVESSSGNLGVALSMICAQRGYRFICVTDARCNLATRQLMAALGSEVRTIGEPDSDGGYLGARLRHVRELCAADPRCFWLNQYANPANWLAHYHGTAPAIASRFPELDVLFVGAGTTGTLMGCARYFREHRPRVRIVAVDAVGSVTFGTPPGPRMIPGLGTGVRPDILCESIVDEVLHIDEPDTIRTCHRLAAAGFLFGGSTGAVVSGAQRWLAAAGTEPTAVAIAPDLGERYLDSIYRCGWVDEIYGARTDDNQTLVRGVPG
ncbi:2,3-diaminopropionate biosynthesis protein SbnA [Sciscionella sediminilitoris]|uniref:2,3-diaminopropionate biosynthesis protein SbnA n=1 Tax=Sciscionella sediminilitoris TaxID=1445613 RepID=UPI000566EEB6|nr:2,3-diaminopropionate biosynthesis protein SbnA [Sciscionella sp. SE31]